MKTHWTERTIEDYVFRIGADLIAQLEDKMESIGLSQNELAEKLRISKGRISQIFNHPGNITIGNIVRCVRALDMKVSIVAYEDGDPGNQKGPINSDVLRICWEMCGKPRDFWEVQQCSLSQGQHHFHVVYRIGPDPFRVVTHSSVLPIPLRVTSPPELGYYHTSEQIGRSLEPLLTETVYGMMLPAVPVRNSQDTNRLWKS